MFRAIYLSTTFQTTRTFSTLKEAYQWCIPQDESEWHRLVYTEVAHRFEGVAPHFPILVSYNDPVQPSLAEAYYLDRIERPGAALPEMRLPQLSGEVTTRSSTPSDPGHN